MFVYVCGPFELLGGALAGQLGGHWLWLDSGGGGGGGVWLDSCEVGMEMGHARIELEYSADLVCWTQQCLSSPLLSSSLLVLSTSSTSLLSHSFLPLSLWATSVSWPCTVFSLLLTAPM